MLNLAVAYELGGGFRAGARSVVYSGIPAEVAYPSATRSPPRAPLFYRFDWRFEKRWRLGDHGFWALVVEVLNTTLHKRRSKLAVMRTAVRLNDRPGHDPQHRHRSRLILAARFPVRPNQTTYDPNRRRRPGSGEPRHR